MIAQPMRWLDLDIISYGNEQLTSYRWGPNGASFTIIATLPEVDLVRCMLLHDGLLSLMAIIVS